MAADPAAYDIDRTDLNDRVYQALRRQILEGSLASGERLSIKLLAHRFQVSVTPVRDALKLLAVDGLVQISPRRGTCVSYPSATDIVEVIQIRELIECACAERLRDVSDQDLAALQELVQQSAALLEGDHFQDYDRFLALDEEIHCWLTSRLHNRRLIDLYSGLRSHTQFANVLFLRGSQRAPQTVAEHQEILTAACARDVERAQRAIRTHLGNAQAELLSRMREVEGEDS